MKICKYCKELNEERYVVIEEVYVDGGYFKWPCPIRFCPYCGKPLDRTSGRESLEEIDQ